MSPVKFFSVFLFLCWTLLGQSSWAEPRPVATHTVKMQDSYQAKRLFSGRVLGSKRAAIGFELDGRVQSVSVDNGDYVEAGSELARLDTEALQIQKVELQAAHKEVSTQLQQFQRDLNRFTELSEKGYVSEGRLDELNSTVAATEARLKQVQQRLRGVELSLSKSVLRAAFPGEVAGLKIEVGAVVGQGRPILELVETAENEAVFGLPGPVAQQLTLGQDVELLEQQRLLHGSVISVARNLDWRTQTRRVRVSLPSDAPLVDGQTTYVLIPQQRRQRGFWLPKQALLEDMRGTWAVYQLSLDQQTGSYTLRKRSVQVIYQYRGQVFVASELQDGDLLVSGGTHKYAPGQQVSIASGLSSLSMTEARSGVAYVQ